jgi:predicted GNAT superfamily acetyltransferase
MAAYPLGKQPFGTRVLGVRALGVGDAWSVGARAGHLDGNCDGQLDEPLDRSPAFHKTFYFDMVMR